MSTFFSTIIWRLFPIYIKDLLLEESFMIDSIDNVAQLFLTDLSGVQLINIILIIPKFDIEHGWYPTVHALLPFALRGMLHRVL